MPLLLAVAGCLAAAAIHVDVAPEHFRESAVYGAFFVAVALAQIAAAWVLWRRPILTCLRVVALGSLAIVALWAWTRSVGVPLGPDAGHTEVVGLLDVLCASAELVTAIGCLALSGAIHVATSGSAGRVIPPAGFKTVAPISRST
jgi:hypothetical protein